MPSIIPNWLRVIVFPISTERIVMLPRATTSVIFMLLVTFTMIIVRTVDPHLIMLLLSVAIHLIMLLTIFIIRIKLLFIATGAVIILVITSRMFVVITEISKYLMAQPILILSKYLAIQEGTQHGKKGCRGSVGVSSQIGAKRVMGVHHSRKGVGYSPRKVLCPRSSSIKGCTMSSSSQSLPVNLAYLVHYGS